MFTEGTGFGPIAMYPSTHNLNCNASGLLNAALSSTQARQETGAAKPAQLPSPPTRVTGVPSWCYPGSLSCDPPLSLEPFAPPLMHMIACSDPPRGICPTLSFHHMLQVFLHPSFDAQLEDPPSPRGRRGIGGVGGDPRRLESIPRCG